MLALLLKGVFFSRKTLCKMGIYDRNSASRCLRRLRRTGVIERTKVGYALSGRCFEELRKISSPGDLERIAEFVYDLYAMDDWDESRSKSLGMQFGEYLAAIRNGRLTVAPALNQGGATVATPT